ncbi:hypothetical protein QWY90_04245 [Flavobacterium paronense]|uniref:DUF3829 domain-containing protein n=1 Tax=Flavobacterium paronense TaxID=1392775 RepID=A0ABV5GH96_9FLAO|nr:hypothetical protein [Flavobacterium paronense]MDN3676516.1 hypothetical protein [Flavobacterium paronense]
MKTSTTKNSTTNKQLSMIFLVLFVSLLPTFLQSQNYRTIDAYMDDFAKNELFVKKSLMDYSVSIVESQLYSRTKVTAIRIIDKLENINSILKTNNKGFEGNTLLRDSFIKLNQKTIDCLKNGSLILNDYTYQSTLSLPEIGENLNIKESNLIAYYQELKKYEQEKKNFAFCYKMHFKNNKAKNILEYNAYQNILFYKMNVMDEKLTYVINAKDKKGFSDCLNTIAFLNEEVKAKTSVYRSEYKDTSLNDANIEYANYIAGQREKLSDLFNAYVNKFNAMQALKNTTKAETSETIAAYNNTVRSYNTKKNLFYAVFNNLQTTKDKMYDSWLTTNGTFLKNNGKFNSIYERYAFND